MERVVQLEVVVALAVVEQDASGLDRELLAEIREKGTIHHRMIIIQVDKISTIKRIRLNYYIRNEWVAAQRWI